MEDFPKVAAAGDILRVHRASAQWWNGMQLTATTTKNAAFLVLHQRVNLCTGLLDRPASAAGAGARAAGRAAVGTNPPGLPEEEWSVQQFPQTTARNYSWCVLGAGLGTDGLG